MQIGEGKNIELKILLIEDNLGDVRLIKEMLNFATNFKFELKNTEDLEQALYQIQNEFFDVILLDLGLPDSSGFQTLIKTREAAENIPIIVLTGLKDESLARRSVQAGAQDYLVKGQVDTEPLVRAIYHAIDRNRMIRTIQSLADDLSKKEKRLRKIIQTSPIAIIITDVKGIIKFFNPATERLFKCNNNSLKGEKFENLVKKEGSKHVSITCGKNDIKYAEVSSVDFQWETEEAMLITLRDITKNRMYKKLLEESEHKYRHLFEKFPFPMVILNKKGIIIDCTSSFLNLIGIEKHEIVNQNYEKTILSPIEELHIFSKDNKLINIEKYPESFELKINKKDNKEIWLELKFYSTTLNNEPLLYITFRDITQIRASEEEMIRLEKTLHEMNSLIEYAPLAIFLMSQEGKILRANQGAKELLKYDEEEFLNSKIFHYFSPKDKKRIINHYQDDIYNLKKRNKIETKIVRKDGKTIEVEITSTILKIAKNIIIQSFISDITSRKQNERNRDLLLDQLNKSLEFKDRFLAEMSHDLRTPLNAIIGFSSLLLEKSYGDLNANQYDFLNDIFSAAEHLDDLIKSMLDLSKIKIGKLKLNKKQFSIFKLLKGLQSIFKPKYEKKGISFCIENINQNTHIYADQLRFKQILFNLIDNAIKFTEKGEFKFRGIERSDHWEFQVIDTGIGIRKEDYELVFREFGRIENDITNNVSGSGIGLALTKRLVELHGGEIWFKSEINKGTIFFFTIPKIRKHQEASL